MVAIVHFAGEGREAHGHEGLHIYAGIAHATEEGILHPPAPHIVVDESHLHPLSGLVDERISYETAEGVVFHDVGADVNMVLSSTDGAEQRQKEVVAGGVDVECVIFERQCPVFVEELLYEHAVAFRELQVFLFYELEHRLFAQLVETSLTDVPLLARVLSEKEIENDAPHRYEHEHHEPCHGLHRLAVFHEHGDDGAKDEETVDEEQQVEHRV